MNKMLTTGSRWLLVAVMLSSASGCDLSVGCDGSGVWALRVSVIDDKLRATCDATVTVRDGTFTATLEKQQSSATGECLYVGPPERPGTYEVTVSRPDQGTAVRTVTVDRDLCHVTSQRLEVPLP